MATPAELATQTLDNKTPKSPRPNHADMPVHLVKAVGTLGTERGNFVEKRVEKILTYQTDVVEKVVRNVQYGIEDTNGHDLTLTLKDSPVRIVHVQVKSSRNGVIEFKQRIRDTFPPEERENMELVKWWMADNGIILLNGGETKTDEDILESFYPQLERIQQRVISFRSAEGSGQTVLFPDKNQVQIWPSVPKADFTQLFL